MGAGINPALNRIAELNVWMRLATLLCRSKPITTGPGEGFMSQTSCGRAYRTKLIPVPAGSLGPAQVWLCSY